MSETELHPRFHEGAARHTQARTAEFHQSRKSALGHLDHTLGTLHTMRQNGSTLGPSVSLGPFIALFIRECESLRSQLEPLDPDQFLESENTSLLMYRLHMIRELLHCFGTQLPSGMQFEARRGSEAMSGRDEHTTDAPAVLQQTSRA